MAKSILGLVALLGVGIGVYMFWNPQICGLLSQISGNKINFCDLSHPSEEQPASTDVVAGGHVEHLLNTTISSPIHKHAVAVHHDKQAAHNNAGIHAAHKALQKKHNLPGGHHLPHLKGAQKCTGVCLTVQCEGCPAPKVTPAKASLGYASDFRMSI